MGVNPYTKLPILATALSVRVGNLEEGGGCSASGRGSQYPTKESEKSDPARRQVAFTGYPDSVSAADRILQMEAYLKKFPQFRSIGVFNGSKGPRNARVLDKVSFAEFICEDVARDFVEKASSVPFVVGEKTLKVKRAKTRFNRSRDWSIRKAHEILSSKFREKSFEIVWKDRVVKVGDDICFSQTEFDARGSFTGNFGHLTLPK